MRRIIVVTAVVSAWLVAAVAPSSAQAVATIVLTPNPLQAGESVTITNSPDVASVCLATTSNRVSEGAPEGGDDVSVLLIQVPGTQEIVTGASVDAEGNWQVVVPVPEAGQYSVAAVCNLNAVSYQEETLSVTAGAEPPTDPPPVAPPPPAAVPQALTPAFTG